MDTQDRKDLLRASRPLHLLSSALLYALGGGIASYLGVQVRIGHYVLGQIWVLGLQLGTCYLGEYLNNPLRTGFFPGEPWERPARVLLSRPARDFTIFISALFYALTAALTVLLAYAGVVNLILGIWMGVGFLGYLSLVIPPVQTVIAGFEDLIHALMLVMFTPLIGFVVQRGELHPFLLWNTFFLFFLHLAMLIVIQFPQYAFLARREEPAFLVMLGWKRGVRVHAGLVIGAFYLLGILTLSGYPARLVVPLLLALPFGGFQVWYLFRIARGAPARWKLLVITSLITFGFSTYLTVFVFWIQ